MWLYGSVPGKPLELRVVWKGVQWLWDLVQLIIFIQSEPLKFVQGLNYMHFRVGPWTNGWPTKRVIKFNHLSKWHLAWHFAKSKYSLLLFFPMVIGGKNEIIWAHKSSNFIVRMTIFSIMSCVYIKINNPTLKFVGVVIPGTIR